MKIVFLVINYMPHQMASIKAICNIYNAEVDSFSYNESHTIPQNIEGLTTYQLKDFNKFELLNKIIEINPQMLVVAGWIVKEYVWVAKQIRKQFQIPVVTYSDTQWRGTIRQHINCLISPWHLQKAFSHIWVAGVYQFEYARKLRFKKNQIIFNSLSCDTAIFQQVNIEKKQNNYPKKFLFVGRFVPIKGLEYLIEAWEQIAEKKGWSLTLIGDGPLKERFNKVEGITIKNFMSQPDLLTEMSFAGCFILPSIYEPWALVIHEAAAAGLPLITTEVCGAVPHFIIDELNGYKVKPGNTAELKQAMEKIISMEVEQLMEFSHNSRKLAHSITPELGAANLMSLISIQI